MADYEAFIEMIKGEGKIITWTFTQNGSPLDLSGATFFLGCKRTLGDSAYLFSHEDADFDKTDVAIGKVSLAITGTDTAISPMGTALECYMQLKTIFAGGSGLVDKTDIYTLKLAGAVVSS